MKWKKIKNDAKGIGILLLMVIGVVLVWFISSLRIVL